MVGRPKALAAQPAHAPIDHLFDGLMSMAAHPEDGATFFELHDCFSANESIGKYGEVSSVNYHNMAFKSIKFYAPVLGLSPGVLWATHE